MSIQDENFRCINCGEIYRSLLSLLDHKVNNCEESKYCVRCKTNISEYNILQHIIEELKKKKDELSSDEETSLVENKLGGKIDLNNYFKLTRDRSDSITSQRIIQFAKDNNILYRNVNNYLHKIGGMRTKHIKIGGKNGFRGWLMIKMVEPDEK